MFKSLVPGQSGDWSVEVLLPPDTVQRLGADPPGCWTPVRWPEWIAPANGWRVRSVWSRIVPKAKLRRLRVLLVAPQPEPEPHRGQDAPVNVNNHSVKEVMNRNNTASRIPLPHGYTGGAADALRPALTLPLERIASSGALYHAAA